MFPDFVWEEILSKYPEKETDFQLMFLASVIFICIRSLLKRYVLYPLGRYYGLKSSEIPMDGNTLLFEELHSLHEKAEVDTKVSELAKKMDLDERQIQRRLRKFSRQRKRSKLIKFAESGWGFSCHLTIHLYGVYILNDTPFMWWLWKPLDYFRDYPYQVLPSSIRWFYIIQIGFYSSEMFRLLQTKRKNSGLMLTHHIVTLLLLIGSWVSLFFRIGTAVAFLHDLADIFLEGAKMAKYIGKQKLCNILFIGLTITWLLTRMVLFPLRIIYPILTEMPDIAPQFNSYLGPALMIVAVFGLLIMHCTWTFFLMKSIKQSLSSNTYEAKDARSDSENSSSDRNPADNEEQNEPNHSKET